MLARTDECVVEFDVFDTSEVVRNKARLGLDVAAVLDSGPCVEFDMTGNSKLFSFSFPLLNLKSTPRELLTEDCSMFISCCIASMTS
jgi:hypothetical protein